MQHHIRSLHHLTATVTDAQDDLDFYVGLLGYRLVKKTVNFDNHHVFHFYYGNERGTPGTIMTTFPYKGMGVRVGVQGAGQVTITSFSVPAASMDFWRARLRSHDVAVEERAAAFGEEVLFFRDPSGLGLQLVGSGDDAREPWVPADSIGIERGQALRGLHGVTLLVREPATSIALLTEMLNAQVTGEAGDITRLGVGGAGAGHVVDLQRAGNAPAAVNGLGTVHHVAFAIDTEDEQLRLREELIQRGLSVTEVRDREYFRSIYFREPNGVLYEVASMPPGFTVDEELEQLGQSLKLPPWEEPHRADIEAHLPRVIHP